MPQFLFPNVTNFSFQTGAEWASHRMGGGVGLFIIQERYRHSDLTVFCGSLTQKRALYCQSNET